jgi:origin recognition complex subunit 4
LFKDQTFLSRYVRPAYHLTKSVLAVFSSLLLPISMILSQTELSIPSILSAHHILSNNPIAPLQAPPSSLPLVLPGLSDLRLALLISAARLDVIHGSDSVSFAMAYAEYVDLASKARVASAASGALASGAGARVWGREIARGEWEGLVKLGLLVPLSETGLLGTAAMAKVDVKLEEIPGAVELSATMERWCRQI